MPEITAAFASLPATTASRISPEEVAAAIEGMKEFGGAKYPEKVEDVSAAMAKAKASESMIFQMAATGVIKLPETAEVPVSEMPETVKVL